MLRIATKQAFKASYRYRLGAVITKGNRVLSTGYNSISFCKLNTFKVSKHAEMDAIQKLLRSPNGLSKLVGSTLYVSRVGNAGTTLLAKPCKRCMNLIHSVGIKEVIFTTDNGQEKLKL